MCEADGRQLARDAMQLAPEHLKMAGALLYTVLETEQKREVVEHFSAHLGLDSREQARFWFSLSILRLILVFLRLDSAASLSPGVRDECRKWLLDHCFEADSNDNPVPIADLLVWAEERVLVVEALRDAGRVDTDDARAHACTVPYALLCRAAFAVRMTTAERDLYPRSTVALSRGEVDSLAKSLYCHIFSNEPFEDWQVLQFATRFDALAAIVRGHEQALDQVWFRFAAP